MQPMGIITLLVVVRATTTNNQRSKLSCRGLFVVIQRYHLKTGFKRLEGNNIYLPFVC